jgi:hypothetical protein
VGNNERVGRVACCILITLRTANRPREGDGAVAVPVIPDGFSEGRVKETVKPCMDLTTKVGETGDEEKAISEPRPKPCGIATAVSGDGALGSEFSEDDELNDPSERR